jgi:septal ring factor EnvC (AmiA/AmiB activator)
MSIAQWGRLEARLEKLETWAGPGQIQALIEGQQALRADMAKVHASLDRHERILAKLKTDVGSLKSDVGTLKTDVGSLKSDMAWVKKTLAEVLRRLPDPPPSPN